MLGPNLHTTVSLKNHVGDLCGGTVEWLTSSELQVNVDGHLELDSNCELRVELRGLPVSIYIHGTVMKLEMDDLGETQTSIQVHGDLRCPWKQIFNRILGGQHLQLMPGDLIQATIEHRGLATSRGSGD